MKFRQLRNATIIIDYAGKNSWLIPCWRKREVFLDSKRRSIAISPIPCPLIEEIRERGEVDPEEIVEALAEALKREYGSNPTRYPMRAILFEAEKP
jgi:hypothetical protein